MTTFTIGAATVTRIEESYEPNFAAATFFPDWRPEVVEQHRDWLVPEHYDPSSGFLKLSVHSWLVRVDGRNVLIDACVGGQKSRPHRPKWHLKNFPYLERLADAGLKPEQIDMVMCTHLHMDHVGWFTRLDSGRWVPTFKNARHVFSQADYDHFLAVDRDPEKGPANAGSFRDSVLPVVEAGLAQPVPSTHAIDEHLSLSPAPGHTPGTVVIRLSSRGDAALFSGDIVHHVIQVYHPDWNSFACLDAVNARASRRKLLEQAAGTGALVMPAHIGAPFAMRVDAKGEGFVPRLSA